MYQCVCPSFRLPAANRPGWCALALLGPLCIGGLALSNPGPAEFESFAADQLVDVLEVEVCQGDVLPTLVRMALRDCSGLVRGQRQAIGALVGRQSRRTDLGLLSVYRSELGGQRLFGWTVPRFRATVLGIAGQFLVLSAGIEERSTATASPGP
jgi:hypothetical protein